MAEQYPSDPDLDALSNTVDADTGLAYPETDADPWATDFFLWAWTLLRVAGRAGDLRVYKDGDATFGVRPGRYMDGATVRNYAGTTGESLTNNQTNYIYLTADATLTVNITGFPSADATPHIPLATIAVSGGDYDAEDDVTDYRGRGIMAVASGLTPAEANALHGRYAVRPAAKAVGAVYFSGRPADDELLTINGRKYETDTDGDFPQAGGDVQLDLQGNATLDEDITDIAADINADSSREVDAVADTTNDVLWLTARTAGAAGNSLTLVTALTNTTVSGATLADGADAAAAAVYAIRHTITAAEAAAGFLRFDTGLSSIESVAVTFEDAGVEDPSKATVTVSGGAITLAEGATAWAADDVLNIIAIGTE